MSANRSTGVSFTCTPCARSAAEIWGTRAGHRVDKATGVPLACAQSGARLVGGDVFRDRAARPQVFRWACRQRNGVWGFALPWCTRRPLGIVLPVRRDTQTAEMTPASTRPAAAP